MTEVSDRDATWKLSNLRSFSFSHFLSSSISFVSLFWLSFLLQLLIWLSLSLGPPRHLLLILISDNVFPLLFYFPLCSNSTPLCWFSSSLHISTFAYSSVAPNSSHSSLFSYLCTLLLVLLYLSVLVMHLLLLSSVPRYILLLFLVFFSFRSATSCSSCDHRFL